MKCTAELGSGGGFEPRYFGRRRTPLRDISQISRITTTTRGRGSTGTGGGATTDHPPPGEQRVHLSIIGGSPTTTMGGSPRRVVSGVSGAMSSSSSNGSSNSNSSNHSSSSSNNGNRNNRRGGSNNTPSIISIATSEEEVRLWIESVEVGSLEELLRSKELKIDSMDEGGMTLLHRSVLANRPEIVRLLVGLGANASLANRDGWSPLHLAAHAGNSDILGFLLKS